MPSELGAQSTRVPDRRGWRIPGSESDPVAEEFDALRVVAAAAAARTVRCLSA